MRARTICSKPGCVNLRPCPGHRKAAFVGRDARALPPGWAALRKTILHRDGHACTCGAHATEVDHIVARANGGSDSPDNLRAVCTRCHRSKTGREAREARL